MIQLGELLELQGDLAGARTAYQQALDSGHADWTWGAAIRLLNVMRDQEDAAGARSAYQEASGAGNPAAPYALHVLGQILHKQGHSEQARSAYQQAIDSGRTDTLVNLMTLLREQGDNDGLRSACQQAIDLGNSHIADYGLLILGHLLRDLGDCDGA